MTDNETLAHRYWTLANYVVGFVAVQTLAWMFVLAQMESVTRHEFLASKCWAGVVLMGVVLATVVYAYLLHGCWKAESDLLRGDRKALYWGKRDYRARWWLVILIQASSGVVFALIGNFDLISLLYGSCG